MMIDMKMNIRKKMLNALSKEELIELVIELQDTKNLVIPTWNVPTAVTAPLSDDKYHQLRDNCTSATTKTK